MTLTEILSMWIIPCILMLYISYYYLKYNNKEKSLKIYELSIVIIASIIPIVNWFVILVLFFSIVEDLPIYKKVVKFFNKEIKL